MVGQHPAWPARRPSPSPPASRRSRPGTRRASQSRLQQPEVERQVQLVRPDVAGQPLVGVHPDLADRHPVRVGVEHPADQPVHVVHLLHVEARVGGAVRVGHRVAPLRPVHVRQPAALAIPCATSIRKPSTPRSSQNRSVALEVGRRPPGSSSPGPAARARTGADTTGRPAPGSRPGRRRPSASCSAARAPSGAAAVPEHVPGPLRAARRRRQRRGEVRVPVGGVVGHQVDGDLDAERVRVGDQRVEVVEVAEQRVHVARVGDVVAVVDHRRRVERGQPERVHAEQVQVAELLPDARPGRRRRRRRSRRSCGRTPGRRPRSSTTAACCRSDGGAEARLSGERCTGLLGGGVVCPGRPARSGAQPTEATRPGSLSHWFCMLCAAVSR